MPFEDEDTRKVRTAVVGRADSDWPVFLPYDHDEFDRFMRGRSRDDFYCGTLLGGCGKKLTPKRYMDKKCHFAHRPPVHCRRTATGEDSADHLYIGQALQRWLRGQGYRRIQVGYPNLGQGPGGIVEVRFGPGARLIRVQLARMPLHEWRSVRERLTDQHALVHWVYGPDSGLAHNEVEALGHAIRFSCRTVAGHREVFVGTQNQDHQVAWTALTDCRLTDQGILTPRLSAEQVNDDGVGDTVMFALAPGSIAFTVAVDVPPAADGSARRVYTADAQPLGSAMVHARISLPSGFPAPLPHKLYLIEGPARLSPVVDADAPDVDWLIRAEGASALPQRTDIRWPSLRPTQGLSPSPGVAPVEPPLDAASVVALFREKLEVTARSRGLINWETLVRHAGAAPAGIPPEERVRLLVALDYPRADGKPVLSSLVKLAHDRPGPAPFFKDVLTGIGCDPGLSPRQVERIWIREREAAYALAAPSEPTPSAPAAAVLSPGEAALVNAFREHLQLVARGRSMVKWEKLLKRQGLRPSQVSDKDRVRLLAAVDQPYRKGRPLLSALVSVEGQGRSQLFGDVLAELGWKPDARTPTAAAAWRLERERAYAVMRSPAKHVATPRVEPESSSSQREKAAPESPLVLSVRRALVDAARRQVCVGWHTLAAAAGRTPEELSDRDRASILVAVDRPAGPEGIVLSSLVIASEHTPVPYFDEILRRLGRPHGLRPIELGQVRKYQMARAFEAYRSTETGPL
ncbi:competence protein CoiA family protein [Streptomyces puniciscabiei]|uniref:competence protein CoiA family protein n=1 Tax=Streptomyces puniciscabiei TaxID=164348 RepID=UPI00378DFF60